MARITADAAGGQNIVAFLDMLAVSEIGEWLLENSDDGYNVLVGSHGPEERNGVQIPPVLLTFASYATHPNILNSELDSTAAGRYQELHGNYAPYAAKLNLTDFSPVSQDLMAIQQIRERGAIPMLLAGQIQSAIAACSNLWASLPGNDYGQHQNQMSMLVAAYQAAGGTVAVA
jgi:muramidase (phage lysozyme)